MSDAEKVRPAKDEAALLSVLLPQVYASKQWHKAWLLFRLTRDWQNIAGGELSRLTRPAWFRQDTLWISVENSVWMHHMQWIKEELIERINRYAGESCIADIRCVLATAPCFKKKPVQRSSYPLAPSPQQEQDFSCLTETIADADCREALRLLWRSFAARAE